MPQQKPRITQPIRMETKNPTKKSIFLPEREYYASLLLINESNSKSKWKQVLLHSYLGE